ncbi:MAG: AEC family transporter [Oscillospiraceae bacterium]|nr:AEC family transporter [Oscillospiraceae bacterium]
MPEPFGRLLSIMLIAALGAFLYHRRWFPDACIQLVSRLILDVALPFSILYTITERVDFHSFGNLRTLILIPALSIGLNYVASGGLTRLLRVREDRRGLFVGMSSNSNSLFLGLPVNTAVFGPDSLPFVYVYYVVSTAYFNTLGVLLLRQTDGKRLRLKQIGRVLATPIFAALALAVGMAAFRLRLPGFLADVCQTLGSLATPLSMLYIGVSISRLRLKNIRLNRDFFAVLGMRFLFSPLAAFGIATLLGAAPLLLGVMVLQAALPVMTSMPIFSQQYGADTDYAILLTSTTALLSIAIIPLLSGIIT